MIYTPIFAGLLALLFVFLSARVIRLRFIARVSVGDGGDRRLVRAIRAHGNFAEYVPIGLILLAVAEIQGTAGWLVLASGILLVVGRCAHAIGITPDRDISILRGAGIMLTFIPLVVLALTLLVDALGRISA